MFDTILVKEILTQIKDALEKIARRTSKISCANDFTKTQHKLLNLHTIIPSTIKLLRS